MAVLFLKRYIGKEVSKANNCCWKGTILFNLTGKSDDNGNSCRREMNTRVCSLVDIDKRCTAKHHHDLSFLFTNKISKAAGVSSH